MKYISVLIFLFVLQWSWAFINDERAVPQSVHIEIQRDMKDIITDYVQKHLPTSRDLRFERFWTENTDINQVKASFIYSFVDENINEGAARIEIEGYAVLNRKDNETGEDTWSFDELRVLNNEVNFQQPTVITPGAEGERSE